MADEPVMPQHVIEQITRQILRLEHATLAAALITASGRPHSVREAIDLMRDLHFATNPQPGSGAYQAWQPSSEARLKMPHK